MANLTIVYWRDIPSMVKIGKGRRAAKASLPERFEQAIDRCAMKIGAKDDDAYIAEWREADGGPVEGDAQEVANETATRLDTEYDANRIKTLIANEGWAAPAS
ncbi:MAG: virulence factor [Pseudomonadota bacterium]